MRTQGGGEFISHLHHGGPRWSAFCPTGAIDIAGNGTGEVAGVINSCSPSVEVPKETDPGGGRVNANRRETMGGNVKIAVSGIGTAAGGVGRTPGDCEFAVGGCKSASGSPAVDGGAAKPEDAVP